MVHLLAGSVPYGKLVQLTLIVSLIRRPYVLLEEECVQCRRLIEVELVLGETHRNRRLAHSRYKVSAILMAGLQGGRSLTLA